MRVSMLILGVMALASGTVRAGLPWIENAEIETRNVDGTASSVVREWSESSTDSTWLGWHVPMLEGDDVLCCWSREDRRLQGQACNLEGSRRHFVFSSEGGRSMVESDTLVILLRAADGSLNEVRAYSDGCQLNGGGRQVLWLDGVKETESVSLLGQLVESRADLGDEALMALALHAAPQAHERLAETARQHPDADLRGEALFWLSQNGVTGAADVIMTALEEDPDSDVREEAIFALSQLPDSRGLPLLMDLLRDQNQPTAIREEAFFWYVQSGNEEAIDLIVEILSR